MRKLLCIFLLFPVTVLAVSFELDLYYGIGIPDFSFNNAPLVVSVYPWKNIGFSTGVEYSMRKKINKIDNIKDVMIITEENGLDPGEELIFSYEMSKYKDELATQILQIPILVKFKSNWFYAATGIKFGIPQNVNVSMSYEGLNTKGCLPDIDVCLENVPDLQFMPSKNNSSKIDIKSKTLIMLALESGVRIKISKNFALVFGAFADYSINEGFNRGSKSTIDWRYTDYMGEATLNLNDGWRAWQPWSVGGVAKLSFGWEK